VAIVPIAVVQNELSPRFTSPIAKGEVAACAERGIAFLAWSPQGGSSRSATLAGSVDPIREVAQARDCSVQQVALAWLRSLSPWVVPIPGSSRPETAAASMAAASIHLDDAERDRIAASLLAPGAPDSTG
jgi:diketogulonate reductase-like aldo/keto reductase